jgi:hypothetical protein
MASSYTTSLKIQQIGAGEQSGIWGSTTNTNWNLIEQAVTGVAQITMANSNYTLSSLNGVSDEARCMVIVASGTNSAVWQIVAPLVKKFYIVNNNTTGGYAVTIGGATGSIVSIPNGTVGQVYCDGTNFFSAQTGSAGNFNVNGTLTAGAINDTGALTVGGISTLNGVVTGASNAYFVSPNNGTTGAVVLKDTAGNPNAVYLQATNNAASVGYASLKFNSNGTLTPSGNIIGNVTGNITGNAATATTAVQIGTTNYTVLESGGFLYFRYGGVNKMRLDSSGNLVCTGNITAFGSI